MAALRGLQSKGSFELHVQKRINALVNFPVGSDFNHSCFDCLLLLLWLLVEHQKDLAVVYVGAKLQRKSNWIL